MTGQGRSRSVIIDALRGLAILGVVYHHIYQPTVTGLSPSIELWGAPVRLALFNHGWLGVDLFFFLSGLVLYRPAIADGLASIARYARARALRLWPLYLVVIVAVAVIARGAPEEIATRGALMLSGLHNLHPRTWMPPGYPWVTWSLGIEILFSILLPVLLIAMRANRFWPVFWAIAVGCVLYRFGTDVAWYTDRDTLGNWTLNPYKDTIFGRLDQFVWGMAAARLLMAPPRLPAAAWGACAIALSLVTLLGWAVVEGRPRDVWVSGLVAVNASVTCAAFFAAVQALAPINLGRLGETALSPLAFLGQICFSLYLVHALFLLYVPVPDWRDPVAAAVWFASAVGVSTVLFLTVEAPGLTKRPAWARLVWGR